MTGREKKILERLAQDGMFLGKVRNITYERCMTAVRENGMALAFVPEESMNADICSAAVKRSPLALSFVPERLQTAAMCEDAVSLNGEALEFVSKDLMNRRICMLAVEADPVAIRFVPKEFQSDEMRGVAAADPDAAEIVKAQGEGISDEWKEALAEAAKPSAPAPRYSCEVTVEKVISWDAESGDVSFVGSSAGRRAHVVGKAGERPDEGEAIRVSSTAPAAKVRMTDRDGRQLSDGKGRPIFVFKFRDAVVGEPMDAPARPAINGADARQRM